jgi:Uma2 family endonuclease
MTATQFRDLPETTLQVELIEGRVTVAPAATTGRQDISGNIYTFLRHHKPGGRLHYSAVDVVLDDKTVLQPDLLWVSEDNPRCQDVGGRWHGPPDLTIEILSPGNAKDDKTRKFELYQAHGVREYWIVDPANRLVEVYVLVDGAFTQQGIFGPADTFSSPVLGDVAVPVKDFFATG